MVVVSRGQTMHWIKLYSLFYPKELKHHSYKKKLIVQIAIHIATKLIVNKHFFLYDIGYREAPYIQNTIDSNVATILMFI